MPPFASVLPRLQRALRDGKLELLVGAGASVASGLPTWDELNRRLLLPFLAQEYRELELKPGDLELAAQVFVSRFGREAVVDVVRSRVSRAQYLRMLRSALYASREPEVSDLHLELAAMLVGPNKLRRIFTFNFDDLLERASERFLPERATSLVGAVRSRAPSVVHLHGLVPAPGRGAVHGPLILSERDYYSADDDWASRALEKLFRDPRRVILLVGLSLGDPRLRWLLLDRLERARRGKPVAEIVVLSSEGSAGELELIERLARTFARQHAAGYWQSWQMTVVQVEAHELVPFHLRQLRLGNAPARWATLGANFLGGSSPVFTRLYEPKVQRRNLEALSRFHALIRRKFAVGQDEQLDLGGYVPGNGRIQLGFFFRDGERADLVTGEKAALRSLRIGKLGRSQGASGHAYVLGTPVETSRRDKLLDKNFTEEMRSGWTRGRTFSSLLTVPVFGSRQWVPLGVTYLASNRLQPFWATLSREDRDELGRLLRRVFDSVLQLRR